MAKPSFKVGDRVRLLRRPPWVDRLPVESQTLFLLCVGRVFPVSDITDDGLIVLDVSELDEEVGGRMNDLRVEPDYIKQV